MQYFPFVVVAWILGIGLYGIVTSRHLVHLIMCLIVVQSSTYVLLLGVGYVTGAVAPYFYDVPVHTPAVDPVVQALAPTDVVVEAAVPGPRRRDRDRLRGGTGQRGPGQPGRGAGDRRDDLLLAVFPPGGHLLPRAHAHLPGRHDGLLPDRGHLRPVRMVRADGSGCLRP